MDQTVDLTNTVGIINRILPILFLIGLGAFIRRRQLLQASTIDDLRWVAVNLALPAVLFLSFLNIGLQTEFFIIFAVIFTLCVLLYLLGKFLGRQLFTGHEYYPHLMTGFEYGMLGVSLFGSAYGLENIGYIAVVDLGHEIFIWFVLLALLLMKRDGLSQPGQIMRGFLTSPVVIGILAGLLFNVLGMAEWLTTAPVTGAVLATFEFLSNMVVPVILIIIGYGIKFDREGVRATLPVIAVRLVILLPLAFLLSTVLVGQTLGLAKGFQLAVFTLLILPPPFIIPLYTRTDLDIGEQRYINNTLTLYTVISIVIFSIMFVLNPVL